MDYKYFGESLYGVDITLDPYMTERRLVVNRNPRQKRVDRFTNKSTRNSSKKPTRFITVDSSKIITYGDYIVMHPKTFERLKQSAVVRKSEPYFSKGMFYHPFPMTTMSTPV